MTGGDLATMLAATFTAGCIMIHELRAHAKAITPVLVAVAICMGALVALMGLADEQPARDGNRPSGAVRAGPPAPAVSRTRGH